MTQNAHASGSLLAGNRPPTLTPPTPNHEDSDDFEIVDVDPDEDDTPIPRTRPQTEAHALSFAVYKLASGGCVEIHIPAIDNDRVVSVSLAAPSQAKKPSYIERLADGSVEDSGDIEFIRTTVNARRVMHERNWRDREG
jgi:hypothetical protein